jgi:hypothetical protein
VPPVTGMRRLIAKLFLQFSRPMPRLPLYEDSLVVLTSDSLLLKCYYFPTLKPKLVSLAENFLSFGFRTAETGPNLSADTTGQTRSNRFNSHPKPLDRLKGFEVFHPELRLTVPGGFAADPDRECSVVDLSFHLRSWVDALRTKACK